jgi:tRNA(Ile)-lysidine synthase
LRPLLDVSKAETEAYCVERGIPYRIDTSNKSLRFTRNRVRWKLMPVLRSFNPRVRESLCRLSRAASEQVSFLEQEAADAWRQAARESAGQSVALAVSVMTALPPLLQAHLLRRAYQSVSGALTALQEVHVQAMVEMLASPPGRTLHLPRGVRMHVGYRELVISKGDTPPPLPLLEGEYILNVPGETRIPGWVVRTELLERPPGVLPDGISTACFDFEALGGKLVVRVVRRGDRFQPLGMEGTRKLHDLFVDEKVPRDWRARVPLVVSERGTAWVVGYRTAHWARVVRDTSATVRVSFAQPK